MEIGKVLESILDKLIEKFPGYEHKLPFFLSKSVNLMLHMDDNLNKIVLLIVNEHNQVVSGLNVILPKSDKTLNISLEEK